MIQRVLDRHGLTGLRPRLIKGGHNNEHWFVGSFVLRRYRETRSAGSIAYEHAVLRHVASAGWPVSAPVADREGNGLIEDSGRLYALFPRLPGRRGDPERPRNARASGRCLARLHEDLASFESVAPPDVFRPLLDYDADGTGNGSHTLGELLDEYGREHPSLSGRLLEAAERIWAESRVVDTSGFVRTLIHGDFHDGNLLFQRGELSGVLDFDFCHPDLRAADLATSSMVIDESDATSFILGYLEVTKLPREELRLIGLLERSRALGGIAASLSIGLRDQAAWERVQDVAAILVRIEKRWLSMALALGVA